MIIRCVLESGKMRAIQHKQIAYITETSDENIAEVALINGVNFGVKVSDFETALKMWEEADRRSR
jgi:hypothetical protein